MKSAMQICLALLLASYGSIFSTANAEVTACAKVKIEIQQELTLERQAFDARMVITNGLLDFSLDEVKIDVIFQDAQGTMVTATSDPNDLSALFFITVSSMSGLSSVNGGIIGPQVTAEIHWLIIPASGAAGSSPLGELYYVGAKVSYKTNGELTEVDIAPDAITVLPQPELYLDYFLPHDVYGDDPLTPAVEPIIPFTLGVRVKNDGYGDANKLKISSSQPKIVDNQQGLLINFKINGSYVDDNPTQPTLNLDFGTIKSGTAKVGRWIMQTSLAGQFTEFNAQFTHSDSLGGALTSLLKEIHTHTLVKDVLVDLPGRDTIKDFLVKDLLFYTIFESEGMDGVVVDNSASSTVSMPNPDTMVLSTPPTGGLFYVRVADANLGSKNVLSVTRGDGKALPLTNAWYFSEGLGAQKQYFFGLFDSNGGGNYTVKIGDSSVGGNNAPIITPITNKTAPAGAIVKFDVYSSDPDGTTPILSSGLLPLGASFTTPGDGSGSFYWKTTKKQGGTYPVTFKATDGLVTTTENVVIKINSPEDKFDPKPATPTPLKPDVDNDGMLDAWEMEYFGDLNQKGHDDFDGDKLLNIQEFNLGTDPTWAANAPTVPLIKSPVYLSTVKTPKPRLRLESSDHGVQVPTYDFELANSMTFDSILDSQYDVKEGTGETTWQVSKELTDGNNYFWRARAKVPAAASEWIYGAFTIDDPSITGGGVVSQWPTPTPGPTSTPAAPEVLPLNKSPRIENPGNSARVDSLRPILSILPSSIPNVGAPQYRFEIYLDKRLKHLVAVGTSKDRFWSPNVDLKNFRKYFFRVRAETANGQKLSTWSSVNLFFTSRDPVNNPPRIQLISPVGKITSKIGESVLFVWTVVDSDSSPIQLLTINGGVLVGFAPGKPVYGTNHQFLFKSISAPVGNYILKLSAQDELNIVDAPQSLEVKVVP